MNACPFPALHPALQLFIVGVSQPLSLTRKVQLLRKARSKGLPEFKCQSTHFIYIFIIRTPIQPPPPFLAGIRYAHQTSTCSTKEVDLGSQLSPTLYVCFEGQRVNEQFLITGQDKTDLPWKKKRRSSNLLTIPPKRLGLGSIQSSKESSHARKKKVKLSSSKARFGFYSCSYGVPSPSNSFASPTRFLVG